MNYRRYRLSVMEIIEYTALYALGLFVVAYLFYDSVYAFFVLLLIIPVLFIRLVERLTERQDEALATQFCEMIGSLSGLISAGMSVENAFVAVRDDMIKLYSENSLIVSELDVILKGLRVGVPLSTELNNLSNRVRSDEIKDFVTVFTEALRTGGNLKDIIGSTVSLMQDKRRTEEEISAMLKGKLMEQKIMCLIPFLIFGYLRVSSKDFISVLYHNAAGIIVMTICLFIYGASVIASEKIVKIKV